MKIKFTTLFVLIFISVITFAQKMGGVPYSYNVDDITFRIGDSEVSATLTVTDVDTVGRVVVNYDWNTQEYTGESSFTLTSPDGSTATIAVAQRDGSYSIGLVDFENEDLAGDWTFTVHDSGTVSDEGQGSSHFVTNIVFDVYEMATTPVISLNDNAVDFGNTPVGVDNNRYGDNFEIKNIGIDKLTLTAISDLSKTDFSTNLTIKDVSLPYGEVYSFEFTYSPTDDGVDSVAFVIQSNGGNDTIILKGTGYKLPDGVVEVGLENWTGTHLPMETGYRYTYSQSIYLQSELNTAKKRISKIYYHYIGGKGWPADISVYMKETDSTELHDYLPFEGFTKVFEGLMTVPDKDGWVEIPLTSPFNYSNTKNIDVAFFANKPIESVTIDNFFASQTIFSGDTLMMSAQRFNDDYQWNPLNPYLYGLPEYYRPNTRFQFEEIPVGSSIALSSSSCDYGCVEAEFSKSTDFLVYNTGVATLNISEISLDAPFTCNYAGEIPVGEHDTITINFEPATNGDFSTIAHIISNSTDTDSIKLVGTAYTKGHLFEDFEELTFPPENWSSSGNDFGWGGLHNLNAFEGDKNGYACCKNGLDTLITPKLDIAKGDVLSFYASATYYSSLYLISSTDMETWTSLDTIELTNDYAQFSIDLGKIAGQTYVGFVAQGYVQLDLIQGPLLFLPLDYDLSAISITGPATTNVNEEVTYNVLVKNFGKTPQKDYQVKLKSGDGTELASVAGNAIGSFNEETYSFNYTFTKAGATTVYCEIVVKQDEDASNNFTEELTVIVQPEGSMSFIVGNGDVLNTDVPINLDFNSSLTETIYFPEEIGIVGGTLNNITYYSHVRTTDKSPLPIRVWVGSTDMMDLTNEFIPATDLTLVFDDSLDFPIGDNLTLINFDIPYEYNGGKLVIMVERQFMELPYAYPDEFYGTTSTEHSRRTRYYRSGLIPNDPYAPLLGEGHVSNFVPKTKFGFSFSGRGHLEGLVYNKNSDSFSGAEIMVEEINFKTVANSLGYYVINGIPVGEQSVIANSLGYYNNTQYTAITEFNTSTLDFIMDSRPQIMVSGNVQKSDAPGYAIENAYVVIGENTDFTDSTGVRGGFNIALWGDETYTINIKAAGYEPYIDKVETYVEQRELDLGTIFLHEISYPVSDVVAEANDNDKAVITWNAPDSSAYFRYDDGTVVGYMQAGLGDAVMGSAFFHNAIINKVSWELLAGYGGNHEKAIIYILALDEFGVPDLYQPLYVSEPIENIDDQWNTYTLDEPIYAPNGFFVGISTPGQYLNIGVDDGVGNPYEFQSGTQWVIGSITSGLGNDGWQNLGDVDIKINFTVRAYGYDNYEIDYSKSISEKKQAENTKILISSVTAPFKAEEPIFTHCTNNSKEFLNNYSVYRLLEESENSATNNWTELVINYKDTTYTDDISDVDYGIYKYAVVADYTDSESTPSFSNVLPVNMEAMLTLNITTNAGDAEGADIILTNKDGNDDHVYNATAPTGGVVVFNPIFKGTYNISVTLNGFVSYTESKISISSDMVSDIPLVEDILLPFNLAIDTITAHSAMFSWNNHDDVFSDDFETYDDFTIDFDPWTLVDVDQSETSEFSYATFTNSGLAMAYIIFNPDMITPIPLIFIEPHSGDKFAACFASTTPRNDDWLITKQYKVARGDGFTFYAKSFNAIKYLPDYYPYELEKFRIGVSTTGTIPSDFEIITKDTVVAQYGEWQKYSYDLSSYAGQNIFVGIECVSNNGFMFMVDDVYMGPVSFKNSKEFVNYNVYLNDTLIANTTSLNYTFTNLDDGQSNVAGVSQVYTSGESDIVTIDFKTPVGINNILSNNSFIIYPNPAKDKLNINSSFAVDKVEIFNSIGELIISQGYYVDGIDVSGLTVGIYIISITSGDSVINKKVTITK